MSSFTAGRETKAPAAIPTAGSLGLPETFRYRLKNRLLGPPLVTEQLKTERLPKTIALAILSSDVMSSCAYATEQILVVLVVAVGVAAYSLVVPITLAVLVVLALVTLSYREVVQAYPRAGGAYVVSRDNFGPRVAQIAGVALLIDYTLTVAVSVAAGVVALTSAIHELAPYNTELSVAFIVLIAYGNLRGIREAGRLFSVPTYAFIGSMAALVITGLVRAAMGHLPPKTGHEVGAMAMGHAGSGIFLGATLFIVLRAFANGGSALTGTEAISNGVSVFRRPEAKNARQTLVVMALILGSMFLGVSVLASWTHPVPFESGSPSVLSQIGHYVFGASPMGHVLYYLLQVATLFILVLAANTSFTGFPFLASFAAGDSFLPRQLTRRGHRLVFSNGIIVLTILSIALVVATRARVSSLISLYAIGVFTGFTMAGAGMVKHHLTHRGDHWRRRLGINLSAAVLSFIVAMVFVITKFNEGAWVVVVLLPALSLLFMWLHRQYNEEAEQLEQDAPRACRVAILARHVVLVLVDRLDLAVARAIQYARTLTPDELRAVHFVTDTRVARELEESWELLGVRRLQLELIDCPDRRVTRAALELVAETLSDGDTEVTVLLPRRAYSATWSRILHDRTADRIADAVGALPHANATIVPFQLGSARRRKMGVLAYPAGNGRPRAAGTGAQVTGTGLAHEAGVTPISDIEYRRRARVAGQVKSVTIQAATSTPRLVCRLEDGTGAIALVFQGRRKVAGIVPGTYLVAEATVNEFGGHPALMNPTYQLIATPEQEESGPEG